MTKLIAPSILSCDFARLAEEVEAVEKAGADWIHVDVMDGHFVPNITIGVPVVKALRQVTKLPLDVHLMINNPMDHVDAFAEAGADHITIHVETCDHIERALRHIQSLDKKAGIALNPSTPLFYLDHITDCLDMILVMTVNPGFGGQSFIEASIRKIQVLTKRLERVGRKIPIEVDGGIGIENIQEVSKAGADVFVAGSAIFNSKDYSETISKMKQALKG